MVPSISEVIGSEWLALVPVRVGGVPSGHGTPNCYVTLADAERPLLRVDVYAYGPDLFAFQDAIVWRDHLVIGFGSHVHVVALTDHSTVTVALGQYFCDLYPTPEYLLIASGERLFRMEPDRSILWKTDALAIDGIVVHDGGPSIIHGDAEQDPPGGWEPFAVSVSDGHIVVPDRALYSEPERGVSQLNSEQASQQVLRRRRRHLTLHACSFGFVVAYLFASNTTAGQWWVLLPVFSWGLALTFHGRFVFSREFAARVAAQKAATRAPRRS